MSTRVYRTYSNACLDDLRRQRNHAAIILAVGLACSILVLVVPALGALGAFAASAVLVVGLVRFINRALTIQQVQHSVDRLFTAEDRGKARR